METNNTEDKDTREVRDLLASAAAQGMWAAFRRWPAGDDFDRVADCAYKAADAMLRRRAQHTLENSRA